MHKFEYYAPDTVEEAVELLGRYSGNTQVLAGGTDLLIRMKRGDWVPSAVVNIKRIPGLRGIETRNGSVWVGPLTTMSDLVRSELATELVPVIAQAASTVGSVQVRNLATVGGNLCNAAPSADTAPPLLALDAQLDISGRNGNRTIALKDFFTGPGETALEADELLTGIRVAAKGWRAGYLKLEHREAMDISLAGVAVACPVECETKDGLPVWPDVRFALGAVAPTAFRETGVEAILRGVPITSEVIEEAAKAASAASRPIDDVRGSAWYRRHVIGVLTRRLLRKLAGGNGS